MRLLVVTFLVDFFLPVPACRAAIYVDRDTERRVPWKAFREGLK